MNGWQPVLLQDDSRGLSGWLANRAAARYEARLAALAIRDARLERQDDQPYPDWRFWLILSPFLAPWVWLVSLFF